MKKILVTGATGLLGGAVLSRLSPDKHLVCGLSSRPGAALPDGVVPLFGDLVTGEGLTGALEATTLVIHCASNPRNPEAVDLQGTRRLLHTLKKVPVSHFVYISIVGVDKSAYPYYRIKLQTEEAIRQSGIPFTILRTTQFHNLVLNLLEAREFSGETLTVPFGMRFQSIHVEEVAEMLAGLIHRQPAGLLPDTGGPEILDIETMAHAYLEARGLPGGPAPATEEHERFELFRSGVNLCPSRRTGVVTWSVFLKTRFGTWEKPVTSYGPS